MKETNIYQKNNTKWPKTEQIILIKWQRVNICFLYSVWNLVALSVNMSYCAK